MRKHTGDNHTIVICMNNSLLLMQTGEKPYNCDF